MPADSVLAFFTFSFIAAVTPGPSVMLVMAAGSRGGFGGGLRCLAGVVAGMALLMGAASLGLAGLVHAWPGLLQLLRVLGAAWLLLLAWRIASAPPLDAHATAAPVGFWQALAFQGVNPKSWVVSLSAAGTFGAGLGDSAPARALAMAALFAAAATPGCALWLGFGAVLRPWLAQPQRSRRFNRAMGLALALSVLLVLR